MVGEQDFKFHSEGEKVRAPDWENSKYRDIKRENVYSGEKYLKRYGNINYVDGRKSLKIWRKKFEQDLNNKTSDL